jgi:hypothetical protein
MLNVILFHGRDTYKTDVFKILMSTDKGREISCNANYTIAKGKTHFILTAASTSFFLAFCTI